MRMYIDMWWMKFKIFLFMFITHVVLLGREIMLYTGFTLVMVALVLFIDKSFLGGILSPYVSTFIQGLL